LRCLSQKSFSQGVFHPSLKTTATKTKPECATDHKQKVLPMIVAVAANVCGYTPLAKPLRKINFPRLSQWSE